MQVAWAAKVRNENLPPRAVCTSTEKANRSKLQKNGKRRVGPVWIIRNGHKSPRLSACSSAAGFRAHVTAAARMHQHCRENVSPGRPLKAIQELVESKAGCRSHLVRRGKMRATVNTEWQATSRAYCGGTVLCASTRSRTRLQIELPASSSPLRPSNEPIEC